MKRQTAIVACTVSLTNCYMAGQLAESMPQPTLDFHKFVLWSYRGSSPQLGHFLSLKPGQHLWLNQRLPMLPELVSSTWTV